MNLTRRSFLKSLGIGFIGYVASKQVALTKDTIDMLAAEEAVTKYIPAITREVNLTRYTNPFSPTGFNFCGAGSYGLEFDGPYYSAYTCSSD